MLISSNTGDSCQKAGQLLYLPSFSPNSCSPGWKRLLHVLWVLNWERTTRAKKNHQGLSLTAFSYKNCSVISWPWAPTFMQPVDLRTTSLQISFHAVLQAPSVPAARFNRSHNSLLGPGRKGFKTLFRAAFYTVSKPVPRELLLLGMCSSLPPRSPKWSACHSQGVSVTFTGQWGRQRHELQRFVSSRFPPQRQGHPEATLWLGTAFGLPRQPICHLAHLHTIYY